jgi:phosphoglucosamine mutase
VWHAVAEEEGRLGDTGRVPVRPSETKAVVRVMVEAETEDKARAIAAHLAAVVATEPG